MHMQLNRFALPWRVVATLAVLLIALTLVARAGYADEGVDVVNLNEASAEVLAQQLHGVGERTAARIVAYREANGPFQRVEDIVLVRGIGERLLERNRGRLSVGPKDPAQSVAQNE